MSQQFLYTLTPLDWTIFFLVLLITFLSIFYGHLKHKKLLQNLNQKESENESLLDLLLMGRRLTLPLFISTLVATWYGGIFGVTQIAYNKGIYNFITQGVFWYFTYLIFAFFLVGRIRIYDARTLPELIGEMFGKKSAKLGAIFNFFNVLPIAYTISLGLFITGIFGGNFLLNTAIGILIVSVYSSFGGLRSVVFSDIIQFFVMCFGVAIVLLFSVLKYGGLDFLRSSLPTTHFEVTGGESFLTLLVWGFIALSTLVDPNFYNRVLAAKSDSVAKKGIIISTVVWILFDICTTSGAMYARAVMPNDTSGQAYLFYAMKILPTGLRGFVLSGILATILSTLDSYLFLAGTTLSYDLFPNKLGQKVNFHRLSIILVGGISLLFSYVFEGNIKLVWKTLGSYSAACLLLPVILGHIFPRRITDNQFVFSCFIGLILTTYWKLAPHQGLWANIDELYAGITGTLVGLVLFGTYQKIIPNRTI